MSEDYTKTTLHSLVSRHHVHGKALNFDGSVQYDTSQDTVTVSPATDIFNGTKNPHWRDQVRSVSNATTPASGVMHKILQYEPYNYTIAMQGKIFVSPTADRTESGYGFPPYNWPPSWSGVPTSIITDTDNRAIRKFLEAADNARSSVELGQDIGEWKETLNGLRRPMDSARSLVTDVLTKFRKRLRLAKRLLSKNVAKAVADSYLEFTFGWKPLAADVGSLIEGLQERCKHPSVQPISASASGHGSAGSESTGQINILGGIYIRSFRSVIRGTYIRRLKGAVKTGADGGAISFAQLAQLDAQHFVPTLWDLLPYSFIADYFVNVGEIINALSFRYSDLAWGCDTSLTIAESIFSDIGGKADLNPGYSLISVTWSGGNARLQTRSFSRGNLSAAALLPTLQFKLPVSSKPWENLGFIGLARAANASIAEEFNKKHPSWRRSS